MHQLATEWIAMASWISHHFRWFFYCHSQHHQHCIGVVGYDSVKTEISQATSIDAFSVLWPIPHQAVALWFSASCLPVQERWSHLKTIWILLDVWQGSETSHSKSSLGNFQHWYLPEMLVNVFSYHAMVKSVFCSCVHRN